MIKNKSVDDEVSLLSDSLMGGINELTPAEVQLQLAKLELEKLQEDRDAVKTKRNIKRRQQESIAKEAKKKRDEELRNQAACSHRKQNGTSALVGMYNHQNVLMGVCQICGKEWINNDMPQDLLPEYNAIGGCGVR